MGFRVPVLEYFSWQPPVLAINIKNISEVQAIKGNRYLISDEPNVDDPILGSHPNCIMYYGDNNLWYFDEPQDAWTITYKERIQRIDKFTNEPILDESGNITYIDAFHVLYYSESEKKWKNWHDIFTFLQTNYDCELGCFLIPSSL